MKQILIMAPILTFLFFLLLDQLAILPIIGERGRAGATPTENILSSLDGISYQFAKNPKPSFVFLGTSRSDMFRNVHPNEYNNNPGLSYDERKILNEYSIETRAVVKASEHLLQYLMFERMTRTHKPSLVGIEMSPEMHNGNSPFNMRLQLWNNIYERKTLFKTLGFLQGELWRESFARVLFATYAYRFSPVRVIEPESNTGDLAVAFLNLRPSTEILPAKHADYQEGVIPQDVYQQKFLGYNEFLIKENVLLNYETDPVEMDALSAMLDLARERGVKVIVWVPLVEKSLRDEWKKRNFAVLLQEAKVRTKNRGFPFYDARSLSCRRFTDSSHLSGRCAPKLAAELIRFSTRR